MRSIARVFARIRRRRRTFSPRNQGSSSCADFVEKVGRPNSGLNFRQCCCCSRASAGEVSPRRLTGKHSHARPNGATDFFNRIGAEPTWLRVSEYGTTPPRGCEAKGGRRRGRQLAYLAAGAGSSAITGIKLQFHGDENDKGLLRSLDRIDGDGRYEAGNLQVAWRFVNRWKTNGRATTSVP
jgi:hypothetical protein